MRDLNYYAHVDKHQSLLQVDIVDTDDGGQAWPKYKKKLTSLQYLSNTSRKRWGKNLVFCTKMHVKVFFKQISLFLVAIAKLT